MNRRRLPSSCLLSLLLFGCGGAAGTRGAMELSLAEYSTVTSSQASLADGGDLALVRPPQGGHVVFVGGVLRGASQPVVEWRARLVDPASGKIVGEDARTITMVSDATPGVFVPKLESYTQVANIPVCPALFGFALHDRRLALELTVTDVVTKDSVSRAASVVPRCSQAVAAERTRCLCECGADYVPGQSC